MNDKNYFRQMYKEIIKKYFKDIKFNSDDYILKSISESLLGCIKNSNNIAVWGAGQHTDELLRYFSVYFKNVNYIIENNIELAKKKYNGYNCIEPKCIKETKIDCIIISSFGSKNEISQEINSINPNMKILDIYKKLEEKGINLTLPFYMSSDKYININKKLELIYNNRLNKYEKIKILDGLLIDYIQINDFKNIFKVINLYKNIDSKKSNEYIKLKLELEEMLNELKMNLKDKKNNVGIMFIDSLRYKDVFELNRMKYLKSLAEQGVYFTNAFSTSITTYESMVSCFNGKMPFDSNNYQRSCIEEDECNFIKKALKLKYNINFYTLANDKFVYSNHINYIAEGQYCSKTLWRYITDLASQDKKNLSLLYFMQESHAPHMGGNYIKGYEKHVTLFTNGDYRVSQSKEEYINQYNNSLNYLDEQLEFYLNFLSSENDVIIFSDHGQIVEQATEELKNLDTIIGWHDDRFKIPLIIKSKKLRKQKVKNLFSLINFNDIICGLMHNKLQVKYRKTVEMEFSKVHNKTLRNNYKINKKYDYINGFKVIRSKNYKVIYIGKNKKIRAFSLKNNIETELKDKKHINKVLKLLEN